MDLELKSKCWKTKQIQFSLKSLTFPCCFWVVEKALKESIGSKNAFTCLLHQNCIMWVIE